MSRNIVDGGCSLAFWPKNIFNFLLKESCNFESQRKTGIVLASLDRIDRLARNVQQFG
jgi:hypothetical protein